MATCPPATPAVVLHGVDDLRFEEVPLAPLAAGSVRVAIKAVGICGSDVHYWRKGRIGDFVLRDPMVIGHESAGVVEAVGEGVTSLRVGDRVALEPGVPCWACAHSREGRYNLDPGVKFFATPPVHGSLAKFVDHPADFCFKLPDNVTLEEGAMCEPLSVGVHACRRAAVQPGKKVAILGAGPIGLVVLMCARAFGADCTVITDLKKTNLDVASQMGASATVTVTPDTPPNKLAEAIKEHTGEEGPDIVFDCCGFTPTMKAAMSACRAGGKIVLIGMGQDEMTLPMTANSAREVDILGSFRYCNTYPTCLELLKTKRVDVLQMITHRYGFNPDEVQEGFTTAWKNNETGAIKVMFNLDGSELCG